MRWKVTGAEAATGKDRVLELDAENAEGAEQLARYNGILVDAVAPAQPKSDAPVLEYRRAGDVEPLRKVKEINPPNAAKLEWQTLGRGEKASVYALRIISLFLYIGGFTTALVPGSSSDSIITSKQIDYLLGRDTFKLSDIVISQQATKQQLEYTRGAVLIVAAAVLHLIANQIVMRGTIRLAAQNKTAAP